MQRTYNTEAHERWSKGLTLTVANLTPVYRREERNAVKKRIEQQLYEIFCKYVSSKT